MTQQKWRINWHNAWKLSQSSGFLSCSQELRSDWKSSRGLDSCSCLRQTTITHSHDPKHSTAVSTRENLQLKCAYKIKLLSHEFPVVRRWARLLQDSPGASNCRAVTARLWACCVIPHACVWYISSLSVTDVSVERHSTPVCFQTSGAL